MSSIESKLRMLASIVDEFKLDEIEAYGLRVTKRKHENPVLTETKPEPTKPEPPPLDPDEALAWSFDNAGRY